jgi:flagellar assembly factor FliW
VPPGIFFPDYEVELDDVTVERLGLTEPADALILVIVTVGERVEEATANLLGPLVVNRHTRQAAQVVLAGSRYETRAPLVAP